MQTKTNMFQPRTFEDMQLNAFLLWTYPNDQITFTEFRERLVHFALNASEVQLALLAKEIR